MFAAVALLIIAALPACHASVPDAVGRVAATAAIGASGVLMAPVVASVPRLDKDPAQIGSLDALNGPPLVGALIANPGWLAVSILIAASALGFVILTAAGERRAAQVAKA